MRIDREKTYYSLYNCICKYDAGFHNYFHWHDNYEILQILEMPCSFLIDGMVINANPGDVIVIGERTVHRFIIEHNNTKIRIIQFSPKVLINVNSSVKPIKTHITFEEIKALPGLESKLNGILDMLYQEKSTCYIEENPFYQSLMTSLFFLLMRYFADAKNGSIKKERKDFCRITEYINEHFTERITVKSLAEMFYISRGRISAMFLKYSGMGINEYINVLRVKNANKLLIDDYSITEAAFESGFQCIRTFNNVYKTVMGISPSEYIKNKRSN